MFRLLRNQLGAIFLGFLLLVGGSVTATFLAVRAQADDATVINLAGRQRMLSQKITWLALNQPGNLDLDISIQLFDRSLRALRDGGTTLDSTGREVILPPAPSPELRARLDEVAETWVSFRAHRQPAEAEALQAEAPVILAQLDSVVSGFEARAQAKVLRLQVIQLTFFFAALALLTWGYWLTRLRIIRPLADLNAATRRMAEGHLADPIPRLGDDELGELSRAFESMRTEVAAARDQLESRVAQRTDEIVSAFEFSQEIVAQLDLEHLLRSVTDRARALVRANAASLCLLERSGEFLELAANSGEVMGRPGARQPVNRGIAARVIEQGETTAVEAACVACACSPGLWPGECLAAPLRAGQATLGALCVVRRNGTRFDADEARALTLLANSAAIAIANARLAEAGKRQAQEAATLAERERLAAELHDHLAQTLSFLNLKTERARESLTAGRLADVGGELGRMKTAIGDAYEQVRDALVGLREPAPAAGNLAEKLAECLAEFRDASGLAAGLNVVAPSALALPRVTQAQVVHILREALTNVRRHAGARTVSVRVERVMGEACLTVTDDGCGFESRPVEEKGHLGLAIMRARAERCGGTLAVESAPGAGTRVAARFPLK